MSDSQRKIFNELHDDHYRMVYQVCLGFLKGNTDQAKDLSQEVFIQVWNHLKNFRHESTYKTWIYRITVNSCLNFLKKEKNSLSFLEPLEESHQKITDDEPDKDDPSRLLYQALGQLNGVDRLITTLMLEDLSYEEISSILGITQTNLRVKIHRIKLKLKKLIHHE